MSSRKLWVFVGLLMAVAAIVSACGGGGGGAGAGAATFNIQGSEFSYQPNAFTVKPGEKVTINFKNAGTVEHTFVLKDLNFKLTAQPGQTVTGTFTAPSTPGTFQFHCDIAGHTEAGMVGTMTVAQ
jgi:plastocyanin